jgi:hypothetical protein
LNLSELTLHPMAALFRLYRGTPVKDPGLLRIVIFLFAIIASLAAWGVVVYVAVRFIRNYW